MYYIKRITMSGPKVETSSVDLDKGVNILYGASNTGKSYIAECIDYMMGNEDHRIDDNKGYDTIRMELDVDGRSLTMVRKLGETKIQVFSNVAGIESGEYTLAGNNRICHVWLRLMGITESHRINKSAHFQREELNNRAFDHAFVIREKNIYSHESILMPGQFSRFPVAKSALLFLMTGNDYDDGVEYEKPEIHDAKKKAVIEFADSQILALQGQEEELKRDIPDVPPSVLKERISTLLSEIDHTESEISDIIQKNKEIGNQIYHLDEEIAEKKVLQNRYKLLQSQYSSDLKRLTFMVEGEIRKKEFIEEAPRECPFCGNHLSEEKTDSCIEAATAEIEKLEPKMADLKSVQKSLKNELEKIISERDRLKALMDELEEQVQQELQPKVDELRTTMADYAVALANHSSLSTLGRAQSTIRENLTEYKSKAEPPKFSIKEYFDQEFMERFQKILDDLLVACKFDGFREAVFDLNTFDVVINGTRKKSQGQGYRAFINVIVSMAMQEYLRKYGVYRPNIFVMDSPILSLKEDVDASELASDSMKSSLFKYFINHPCAEQIIIIENEVPELDYAGVNMRKFSKGNGFWKTDPTTYQG